MKELNQNPNPPTQSVTPARLEIAQLFREGKITYDDFSLACAIIDCNRELVDLLKR